MKGVILPIIEGLLGDDIFSWLLRDSSVIFVKYNTNIAVNPVRKFGQGFKPAQI